MKYFLGRKNILVTGGAGFLGSHLCEALIKDANVICVDAFVGGGGDIKNIEYLLQNPNFRFIKQDINQNFNFVSQICSAKQTLMHPARLCNFIFVK